MSSLVGVIRSHLVPIVLAGAGATILGLFLFDLLVHPVQTVYGTGLTDLFVGVALLALGGLYEWTIQKEQEAEQQYQAHMRWLDRVDDELSRDRN